MEFAFEKDSVMKYETKGILFCVGKYCRTVIHLAVLPASQTHKFLKRCTNLVLHAYMYIWMQTIMTMTRAYVFSSLITGHLTGWSDMDQLNLLTSV